MKIIYSVTKFIKSNKSFGFGIFGIIIIIAVVAVLGGGYLLFFKPQISGLSLTTGPVGTEIVVTGRSFTPRETMVLFSGYNYVGCITPSQIAGTGKELRFIVPNGLRGCGKDGLVVTQEVISVNPGDFKISVRNAWGESNSAAFTVTPQALPIEGAKPVSKGVDTSNWKTYRNEQYGFEVRYPPEIEVQESGVDKNEVEMQKGKEISSVYTALWFRPATKLPADSHTLLVISATPRIEYRPLLTSSKPLYILDGFYYFPSDAVGEVGKMAKEILSTFKFFPLEKP